MWIFKRSLSSRCTSLCTYNLVHFFLNLMSLHSLLVLGFLSSPFFYLLKNLCHLSCSVSHKLDFADYTPIVQFNMFLCLCIFNKLSVRSRNWIALSFVVFRATIDGIWQKYRSDIGSGFLSFYDVNNHWCLMSVSIH